MASINHGYFNHYVYYIYILCIYYISRGCETSAWLREREDKISAENCPQPKQGKEDYPSIHRLDLTEEETQRLFNDDRYIMKWSH